MSTGLVGSSGSLPSLVIPGYGAALGYRFRRSSRNPRYRVQVLEQSGATFAIGDVIAEFDRFKNLGYGDWANNVPEAFFTVLQDDPKITALRDKGGRAHVRIYRGDDLVWCGWVSLERDANSSDAIFYCYGYLAGTFWLHSDWEETWTSETVGTIVTDAWTRAKTTLTKSKLAFVTTGTIQEPPTVAGGSTPITLPEYKAYYKRILFLLQEMAALAGSDTGNSTIFEITHAESPTFNFWSDRSRDLTNVRWTWGDSVVEDFREYKMPVYHRNDILSVGQQPRDLILRTEVADTTDMDAGWGRMQESLFFPWVRDEDELTRVTNFRAAKAKRDDVNLMLSFYPGSETPPGAADSRWRKGDTVPVKIDRGVTNIDARFQIAGYMVGVLNGQEKINVMIQEPA